MGREPDMTTRREFIESATVVLLMIPLAECSSSSPSSPSANPSAQDGGCDGVASTSTSVAQHVHTLCVPASDLTNPPPAASYTTTLALGHTHGVNLTQVQLQQIQSGHSVTIMTTSTSSHTHDFMIQKA
jgi:hypothetical protein